MGPLIFVARKHQIQRKKSQLNMRLMQIQNQREKIAEQIGQAQQAKTARQNLFNSTSRMAQNSIMAMMNIQQLTNGYLSNNALNQGMLDAYKNYNSTARALSVNKEGALTINSSDENLVKALTGLSDVSQYKNGNEYVIPKDVKNVYGEEVTKENIMALANDTRNNSIQEAYNSMNNQQLQNLYNQMECQNMMNANNLFNNLINNISNLSDEAELESLNAIDSQLEQEQTTVETQLKMLEAELQSVDKQLDNEIKQSAPKFGLSG